MIFSDAAFGEKPFADSGSFSYIAPVYLFRDHISLDAKTKRFLKYELNITQDVNLDLAFDRQADFNLHIMSGIEYNLHIVSGVEYKVER